MVTASDRVERVRHGFQARIASVVRVEDVAPAYRRITLTGDDLDRLISPSPRDHVRLVLPLDPEQTPVLPQRGAKDGPAEPAEQVTRTYSLRRLNPDQREVQIDFVLHDAGPATAWARQARPGQKVGIVGPSGSKIVHPLFDWFLMIGDETMLPSVERQIEELPAELRLIAYIEVDGPANELAIEAPGNVEVHWVHRNGAAPGYGTALLDAVRSARLPAGEGYVFAGGEANQLRPIRRYLLSEAGLTKGQLSMSGHWKLGEAAHDHHEPIDPEEG